jgi:hypothetical protein
LDTWLYAGASLTGNETGFETPDHATLRAGVRQRFGALGAELSWRHSRFFSDDDREHASRDQRLRLALDWQRWRWRSDRLGLGAVLDYDANDAELSVRLELNWAETGGRGLRDWRPGTLDFRDLRERQRLDALAEETQ